MTLDEAATFYRAATSLLEKVEEVAAGLDADRVTRANAARDAAEYAKSLTNAFETELIRAAGGRYWDAVDARYKRSHP